MVKLFLERKGAKCKILLNIPNISPGRVLFQKVTVRYFSHIWRRQNDLLSVGKVICVSMVGLKSRWNFDQPAKCLG